jgi:PhnB protein
MVSDAKLPPHLCVKGDANAAFKQAVSTQVMELQDTFWGSRYAHTTDPFGHVWALNAPFGE